MATGQFGSLLDPSQQGVTTGTATGGSSTTLVDTAQNFVALGWIAGDTLILADGGGAPQRLAITVVAATTLTFAPTTSAPAAGTKYMLLRPPFVQLWGSARIRHEHRVPIQPVPGRAGDVVQSLNRSSRRVFLQAANIYRHDVAVGGRDSANVADAQQLRTWSDAGTILSFNSLTESGLRVRITAFEVTEDSGKGFPVELEAVEAA